MAYAMTVNMYVHDRVERGECSVRGIAIVPHTSRSMIVASILFRCAMTSKIAHAFWWILEGEFHIKCLTVLLRIGMLRRCVNCQR